MTKTEYYEKYKIESNYLMTFKKNIKCFCCGTNTFIDILPINDHYICKKCFILIKF